VTVTVALPLLLAPAREAVCVTVTVRVGGGEREREGEGVPEGLRGGVRLALGQCVAEMVAEGEEESPNEALGVGVAVWLCVGRRLEEAVAVLPVVRVGGRETEGEKELGALRVAVCVTLPLPVEELLPRGVAVALGEALPQGALAEAAWLALPVPLLQPERVGAGVPLAVPPTDTVGVMREGGEWEELEEGERGALAEAREAVAWGVRERELVVEADSQGEGVVEWEALGLPVWLEEAVALGLGVGLRVKGAVRVGVELALAALEGVAVAVALAEVKFTVMVAEPVALVLGQALALRVLAAVRVKAAPVGVRVGEGEPVREPREEAEEVAVPPVGVRVG
jgi:hypothetical protein